jgi:hypothetical protein
MKYSRTDKAAPSFASWLDPEFVLHALFGLLVVGLGGYALARWAISSWAVGERTLPAVVFTAVAVALVAGLVMLRTRKRLLYLGLALALVGVVSIALASAGYSIPHSWFG